MKFVLTQTIALILFGWADAFIVSTSNLRGNRLRNQGILSTYERIAQTKTMGESSMKTSATLRSSDFDTSSSSTTFVDGNKSMKNHYDETDVKHVESNAEKVALARFDHNLSSRLEQQVENDDIMPSLFQSIHSHNYESHHVHGSSQPEEINIDDIRNIEAEAEDLAERESFQDIEEAIVFNTKSVQEEDVLVESVSEQSENRKQFQNSVELEELESNGMNAEYDLRIQVINKNVSSPSHIIDFQKNENVQKYHPPTPKVVKESGFLASLSKCCNSAYSYPTKTYTTPVKQTNLSAIEEHIVKSVELSAEENIDFQRLEEKAELEVEYNAEINAEYSINSKYEQLQKQQKDQRIGTQALNIESIVDGLSYDRTDISLIKKGEDRTKYVNFPFVEKANTDNEESQNAPRIKRDESMITKSDETLLQKATKDKYFGKLDNKAIKANKTKTPTTKQEQIIKYIPQQPKIVKESEYLAPLALDENEKETINKGETSHDTKSILKNYSNKEERKINSTLEHNINIAGIEQAAALEVRPQAEMNAEIDANAKYEAALQEQARVAAALEAARAEALRIQQEQEEAERRAAQARAEAEAARVAREAQVVAFAETSVVSSSEHNINIAGIEQAAALEVRPQSEMNAEIDADAKYEAALQEQARVAAALEAARAEALRIQQEQEEAERRAAQARAEAEAARVAREAQVVAFAETSVESSSEHNINIAGIEQAAALEVRPQAEMNAEIDADAKYEAALQEQARVAAALEAARAEALRIQQEQEEAERRAAQARAEAEAARVAREAQVVAFAETSVVSSSEHNINIAGIEQAAALEVRPQAEMNAEIDANAKYEAALQEQARVAAALEAARAEALRIQQEQEEAERRAAQARAEAEAARVAREAQVVAFAETSVVSSSEHNINIAGIEQAAALEVRPQSEMNAEIDADAKYEAALQEQARVAAALEAARAEALRIQQEQEEAERRAAQARAEAEAARVAREAQVVAFAETSVVSSSEHNINIAGIEQAAALEVRPQSEMNAEIDANAKYEAALQEQARVAAALEAARAEALRIQQEQEEAERRAAQAPAEAEAARVAREAQVVAFAETSVESSSEHNINIAGIEQAAALEVRPQSEMNAEIDANAKYEAALQEQARVAAALEAARAEALRIQQEQEEAERRAAQARAEAEAARVAREAQVVAFAETSVVSSSEHNINIAGIEQAAALEVRPQAEMNAEIDADAKYEAALQEQARVAAALEAARAEALRIQQEQEEAERRAAQARAEAEAARVAREAQVVAFAETSVVSSSEHNINIAGIEQAAALEVRPQAEMNAEIDADAKYEAALQEQARVAAALEAARAEALRIQQEQEEAERRAAQARAEAEAARVAREAQVVAFAETSVVSSSEHNINIAGIEQAAALEVRPQAEMNAEIDANAKYEAALQEQARVAAALEAARAEALRIQQEQEEAERRAAQARAEAEAARVAREAQVVAFAETSVESSSEHNINIAGIEQAAALEVRPQAEMNAEIDANAKYEAALQEQARVAAALEAARAEALRIQQEQEEAERRAAQARAEAEAARVAREAQVVAFAETSVVSSSEHNINIADIEQAAALEVRPQSEMNAEIDANAKYEAALQEQARVAAALEAARAEALRIQQEQEEAERRAAQAPAEAEAARVAREAQVVAFAETSVVSSSEHNINIADIEQAAALEVRPQSEMNAEIDANAKYEAALQEQARVAAALEAARAEALRIQQEQEEAERRAAQAPAEAEAARVAREAQVVAFAETSVESSSEHNINIAGIEQAAALEVRPQSEMNAEIDANAKYEAALQEQARVAAALEAARAEALRIQQEQEEAERRAAQARAEAEAARVAREAQVVAFAETSVVSSSEHNINIAGIEQAAALEVRPQAEMNAEIDADAKYEAALQEQARVAAALEAARAEALRIQQEQEEAERRAAQARAEAEAARVAREAQVVAFAETSVVSSSEHNINIADIEQAAALEVRPQAEMNAEIDADAKYEAALQEQARVAAALEAARAEALRIQQEQEEAERRAAQARAEAEAARVAREAQVVAFAETSVVSSSEHNINIAGIEQAAALEVRPQAEMNAEIDADAKYEAALQEQARVAAALEAARAEALRIQQEQEEAERRAAQARAEAEAARVAREAQVVAFAETSVVSSSEHNINIADIEQAAALEVRPQAEMNAEIDADAKYEAALQEQARVAAALEAARAEALRIQQEQEEAERRAAQARAEAEAARVAREAQVVAFAETSVVSSSEHNINIAGIEQAAALEVRPQAEMNAEIDADAKYEAALQEQARVAAALEAARAEALRIQQEQEEAERRAAQARAEAEAARVAREAQVVAFAETSVVSSSEHNINIADIEQAAALEVRPQAEMNAEIDADAKYEAALQEQARVAAALEAARAEALRIQQEQEEAERRAAQARAEAEAARVAREAQVVAFAETSVESSSEHNINIADIEQAAALEVRPQAEMNAEIDADAKYEAALQEQARVAAALEAARAEALRIQQEQEEAERRAAQARAEAEAARVAREAQVVAFAETSVVSSSEHNINIAGIEQAAALEVRPQSEMNAEIDANAKYEAALQEQARVAAALEAARAEALRIQQEQEEAERRAAQARAEAEAARVAREAQVVAFAETSVVSSSEHNINIAGIKQAAALEVRPQAEMNAEIDADAKYEAALQEQARVAAALEAARAEALRIQQEQEEVERRAAQARAEAEAARVAREAQVVAFAETSVESSSEHNINIADIEQAAALEVRPQAEMNAEIDANAKYEAALQEQARVAAALEAARAEALRIQQEQEEAERRAAQARAEAEAARVAREAQVVAFAETSVVSSSEHNINIAGIEQAAALEVRPQAEMNAEIDANAKYEAALQEQARVAAALEAARAEALRIQQEQEEVERRAAQARAEAEAARVAREAQVVAFAETSVESSDHYSLPFLGKISLLENVGLFTSMDADTGSFDVASDAVAGRSDVSNLSFDFGSLIIPGMFGLSKDLYVPPLPKVVQDSGYFSELADTEWTYSQYHSDDTMFSGESMNECADTAGFDDVGTSSDPYEISSSDLSELTLRSDNDKLIENTVTDMSLSSQLIEDNVVVVEEGHLIATSNESLHPLGVEDLDDALSLTLSEDDVAAVSPVEFEVSPESDSQVIDNMSPREVIEMFSQRGDISDIEIGYKIGTRRKSYNPNGNELTRYKVGTRHKVSTPDSSELNPAFGLTEISNNAQEESDEFATETTTSSTFSSSKTTTTGLKKAFQIGAESLVYSYKLKTRSKNIADTDEEIGNSVDDS